MSHAGSHAVCPSGTGHVTDDRSHASPDQTRPDQTVFKASGWLSLVQLLLHPSDRNGERDKQWMAATRLILGGVR